MVALGLLAGAKVLNVCVPVMFKMAVDNIAPAAATDLTDVVTTVSTFSLAILVGCKIFSSHQ